MRKWEVAGLRAFGASLSVSYVSRWFLVLSYQLTTLPRQFLGLFFLDSRGYQTLPPAVVMNSSQHQLEEIEEIGYPQFLRAAVTAQAIVSSKPAILQVLV